MKKVYGIFRKEMAGSEPILIECWSTENKAVSRMYSEYMLNPRSCFYNVSVIPVNTAESEILKVGEQPTNKQSVAQG